MDFQLTRIDIFSRIILTTGRSRLTQKKIFRMIENKQRGKKTPLNLQT